MPSQSPSMRLLGRLPSLNLDDDDLRRSRSSKLYSRLLLRSKSYFQNICYMRVGLLSFFRSIFYIILKVQLWREQVSLKNIMGNMEDVCLPNKEGQLCNDWFLTLRGTELLERIIVE